MTKTKKQATKQEDNRAEEQAKAQLASVMEMVKALDTEDDEKQDEARERIQEDALSVQVRSDWYTPGEKPEATEFEILLCTGGPAVRIFGKLDEYNQPSLARIEYQDWFTKWTPLALNDEEAKAVLEYSQQFYFGE